MFCYNMIEVINVTSNSIVNNNAIELMEQLQTENTHLMEENKKLSETVDWMHDMIWRLVHTQHSES